MENQISTSNFSRLNAPTLWQPWTWQAREATQQPEWGGVDLSETIDKIATLPPLISAQEIDELRTQVAEAALGRRFILQAGDCAERFQDCNEDHISGRLKILMQMGLVIGHGLRKPIVRIGRMAGQYAKPRSSLHEKLSDGSVVMSFRGENINSFHIADNSRTPDPKRLLDAYHHSGATLNFMRTLIAGGFTDLKHIKHWNLPKSSRASTFSSARYEKMANALVNARAFFESQDSKATGPNHNGSSHLDFFVSHEALVLSYEEALTRYIPESGRWYNLGAHTVWIGDRTRDIDGAHVEYCRGIGNPVGVKVSSESDPRDLLELVKKLNPHNECGKLFLITRFGDRDSSVKLPSVLKAVKDSGLNVTWSCDPMHGNTELTEMGLKTRKLSRITAELQNTIQAHKNSGTILGGVHLEVTHEPVTECLGGGELLIEEHLSRRYETWCDPRLNDSQSLEIAFALSELL